MTKRKSKVYPTPVSTRRRRRMDEVSNDPTSPTEEYLSARRRLGSIAGGTLGFIGMGVPGATIGAAAGEAMAVYTEPGVSNTVSLMKSSGINSLAGRATMTRINTKVTKATKKKGVRVPKKLKKQIKQVLKSKMIYGEYKEEKVFLGGYTIGNSAAVTKPQKSVLGMASQYMMSFPGNAGVGAPGISNSRCLFQCFSIKKDDAHLPASYSESDVMMYFHPLKILNAASVLWNDKPIRNGWLVEGGNITTRVDSATGAVDNSLIQNVKIDIVDSFVTFEIKNHSGRSLVLQIFHCYPKTKVAKSTALTSFIDSINEDGKKNGPLTLDNYGYADLIPFLDPGDSKQFRENWKYERVNIIIKAGETCKHTLQGPKNFTYDFSKLYLNGEDLNNFIPKHTCNVMIGVVPEVVLRETDYLPGRLLQHNVVDKAYLGLPFTVRVQETFKLRCPENAGFIEKAVSAGDGQTLNLRRFKKAFIDFSNQNYDPSVTYNTVDEENPLYLANQSNKI